MSAPVQTPPPTTEGTQTCPRCGAPSAPKQEYCLDCGLRLPPSTGVIPSLERAWRRRLPWYPGDWIWPALLTLGIAIVGAAIAIVAQKDGGSKAQPTIVATNPTQFRPTTTASTETAPEPSTTIVATRPTRPSTRPKTTPAKPKLKPAATLVAWPARTGGYTVVVSSVPTRNGLAQARAKAREALRSGLPKVGVIDSSKFSSLHPGYYVVFSGIYRTLAQSQAAAGRAQSKYPAAYARQITP